VPRTPKNAEKEQLLFGLCGVSVRGVADYWRGVGLTPGAGVPMSLHIRSPIMSDSPSKVVQFSEVRKEKQENLKREYERVLFNRILGAYTVVERLGLKPVEMRDISRTGCSFRSNFEDGAFSVGEELEFRFYFSNTTYLPIRIKIKRVMPAIEGQNKFYDHGCSFDQEMSTYPAIEKFVEFINAYAEAAREDKKKPDGKQFWF
jgi:hypothetical protein